MIWYLRVLLLPSPPGCCLVASCPGCALGARDRRAGVEAAAEGVERRDGGGGEEGAEAPSGRGLVVGAVQGCGCRNAAAAACRCPMGRSGSAALLFLLLLVIIIISGSGGSFVLLLLRLGSYLCRICRASLNGAAAVMEATGALCSSWLPGCCASSRSRSLPFGARGARTAPLLDIREPATASLPPLQL